MDFNKRVNDVLNHLSLFDYVYNEKDFNILSKTDRLLMMAYCDKTLSYENTFINAVDEYWKIVDPRGDSMPMFASHQVIRMMQVNKDIGIMKDYFKIMRGIQSLVKKYEL